VRPRLTVRSYLGHGTVLAGLTICFYLQQLKVSIETGLKAAEKLQSVLGAGDTGAEILRMRVQMGRVIDAMKATVPEHLWAEIVARLNEPGPGRLDVPGPGAAQPREAFDPDEEDDEDDDEPFDPGGDGDDDDF
jgi:hypothetical protein